MPTLRLEIVTPEGKSYSDTVEMVVIPGVEGELGVLPDHSPLMTQLIPGELRVTRDGLDMLMAVGEGFVEITQDKVAVLTDMAVRENDIDEGAVEAAIARAQESLKNETLSKEDAAGLTASLQKSLVQLHMKRRRRG